MGEELIKRINELIAHLCISPSELAKRSGVDASNFNKMLKGSQKITKQTLRKIADANNVSISWLLTGEGEMLKGGKSNDTVSISGNDIKEGDFSGTLVYDIDATCGTDCRDILFAKDDIIGSINLPGIRKDSVIIRANGDSMEPRVCDGNLVVIRQIYSWDDIFYGQIYMILLDEYRMIKYIRKCQEDEANYIILHSENPAYDDIRLNKGKIRKLFIVENILAVRAQL